MADDLYEHKEEDTSEENGDPEVPIIPHDEPIAVAAQDTTYHTRNAIQKLQPVLRWFWRLTSSASFWTAAATVVIAVATIYYTRYARRQWEEMTKATEATKKAAEAAESAAKTAQDSFVLSKRHTEDTDEAICQIGHGLQLGGNLETITIANVGKISAHHVEAHIDVSRNSLPENKRIALLGHFDISQDELKPLSPPITRELILQNPHWTELYGLQETIVVSGNMKYENGFDDWRQNNFCQAFLVQPASQNSTYNGQPIATASGADCERIPEMLQRFREPPYQVKH
jgi:hypothetical protein